VVGDSHAAALIPLAADLTSKAWHHADWPRAGCPFPATAHGHLGPWL